MLIPFNTIISKGYHISPVHFCPPRNILNYISKLPKIFLCNCAQLHQNKDLMKGLKHKVFSKQIPVELTLVTIEKLHFINYKSFLTL